MTNVSTDGHLYIWSFWLKLQCLREETRAFLKSTILSSVYYLNCICRPFFFFIANAIEVLYFLLVKTYLQLLVLKILPTTRNNSIIFNLINTLFKSLILPMSWNEVTLFSSPLSGELCIVENANLNQD